MKAVFSETKVFIGVAIFKGILQLAFFNQWLFSRY